MPENNLSVGNSKYRRVVLIGSSAKYYSFIVNYICGIVVQVVDDFERASRRSNPGPVLAAVLTLAEGPCKSLFRVLDLRHAPSKSQHACHGHGHYFHGGGSQST